MSVQYLSDTKGQITAVQVPIEEWKVLKNKYPDIDSVDMSLPEWQMELLDIRLNAIKENPERLLPIDSLLAELDDTHE